MMWFPEVVYTIDILFIAFVLFFSIRGVWNGLSGELAHAVTLAVLLIGVCFSIRRCAIFSAISGVRCRKTRSGLR